MEALGPYRVERSRIWHGRRYCLAVDTRFDRQVYLVSAGTADVAAVRAELAHPHLPEVLDIYADKAVTFVVLAPPAGRCLSQQLPGDSESAWHIAWAVLEGVAHLHHLAVPIYLDGFGPGAVIMANSPMLDYPRWILGAGQWVHPGQVGRDPAALDTFSTGAFLHWLLTHKDPLQPPFLFLPLHRFRLPLDPILLDAAQEILRFTLWQKGDDAAAVVQKVEPLLRERALVQGAHVRGVALKQPPSLRQPRIRLPRLAWSGIAMSIICLLVGVWVAWRL